jgi:hypothetical protein
MLKLVLMISWFNSLSRFLKPLLPAARVWRTTSDSPAYRGRFDEDIRHYFLHNKFRYQRNRGEQFCSVNDGGRFYRLSGRKRRSQ